MTTNHHQEEQCITANKTSSAKERNARAQTTSATPSSAAAEAAHPSAHSSATRAGRVYSPLSIAAGLLANTAARTNILSSLFESYQRRGLSLAQHLELMGEVETARQDLDGVIAILSEIRTELLIQKVRVIE